MLLSCLRESREAARAVFLACGSPARLSKLFFSISGTPRDRQSGFSRLRDFRKSVLSFFLVCGNPASLSKRFLAFAGLPRARRLSLRKGGQRRPPWRKRRPPEFCTSNSSENRPLSCVFEINRPKRHGRDGPSNDKWKFLRVLH